jgi:hypothetical protein
MAQPNSNATPAWAKLRKSFDSYFKPQGKPTFGMGRGYAGKITANNRPLQGAYNAPNSTLTQNAVAGGKIPTGGWDRAPSGPLAHRKPAAQQVTQSKGPALSPTNDARQNALLRRLQRRVP